ncbi:hypothetical protein HDV00_001450 [Rhizophlyctis rosea]|nr:hypothetical protein HDV00_001450 [Rhizophlyctis rosea]
MTAIVEDSALLSFPKEVFPEIASHLQLPDCKAFRRTCRTVADGVDAFWLFQHHVYNFEAWRDAGGKEFAMTIVEFSAWRDWKVAAAVDPESTTNWRFWMRQSTIRRNAEMLLFASDVPHQCTSKAVQALVPLARVVGECLIVAAQGGWVSGAKILMDTMIHIWVELRESFDWWNLDQQWDAMENVKEAIVVAARFGQFGVIDFVVGSVYRAARFNLAHEFPGRWFGNLFVDRIVNEFDKEVQLRLIKIARPREALGLGVLELDHEEWGDGDQLGHIAWAQNVLAAVIVEDDCSYINLLLPDAGGGVRSKFLTLLCIIHFSFFKGFFEVAREAISRLTDLRAEQLDELDDEYSTALQNITEIAMSEVAFRINIGDVDQAKNILSLFLNCRVFANRSTQSIHICVQQIASNTYLKTIIDALPIRSMRLSDAMLPNHNNTKMKILLEAGCDVKTIDFKKFLEDNAKMIARNDLDGLGSFDRGLKLLEKHGYNVDAKKLDWHIARCTRDERVREIMGGLRK